MGMRRREAVRLVLAGGSMVFATRLRALDLPDIQKQGVLRVLVVDGSPGFFALKPKPDRPGMEREILEGFCTLQKLKLTVVEVPSWDLLIKELLAGRGDVAAGGITVTESRRKLVSFTSEVFPTREIVLTRKPHRVVETLAQLAEEKVGVIKGTSMADTVAALKLPAKNIDDSLASDGLAPALRSGQVTAVVDGVEDALLLQQADPTLQIGMSVGAPSSLAFAVRNEDVGLRQSLDAYVTNVRRTPTWNRLVVKYFGASAIEVLKKARAG